MDPFTTWEISVRLAAATILGALIGLEREAKNHPAGLRTHTILCAGSALIMLISIKVAHAGGVTTQGFNSDPGRIAAQVVSGIGFLGGGAILRMGLNVRGLTTAASIWTVAGIGLAAGAGLYIEAGLATAIVLTALWLMSYLERKYFISKKGYHTLALSLVESPGIVGHVTTMLEKHQAKVNSMSMSRNPIEGKLDLTIKLRVEGNEEINTQDIIHDLSQIPGLDEVEFL